MNTKIQSVTRKRGTLEINIYIFFYKMLYINQLNTPLPFSLW